MDFDDECDFADQGPLTDMDVEEDAEMLALLLKHMPSCIAAADIEQLVETFSHWMQMQPMSFHEANASCRTSSVNTIPC